MKLQHSAPFDRTQAESFLNSLLARPAVFALWPRANPVPATQPYLGRTSNLRHRLERLLASPRPGLRRLNLNQFTERVDYQYVGSGFEAFWLIYLLNRAYYPRAYRQRLRLKPPPLLKVNLSNRFPRCYFTRRLARDGALYYGPFPSRAEAERFAGEFLDLFKIRRCVEELDPDPSHPGCIYSQMRMCLAPCFAGCTDDEYKSELVRAVGFLNSEGGSLVRELEGERDRASEALDFEQAARAHHRLEKVGDVLRRRPPLAGNLADLHAVILGRGAESNSVVFSRVRAGKILGPATLVLDGNVASPVSLDRQIQAVLDSLADSGKPDASSPPPWEHLSILARWYYSSFREGEFIPLGRTQEIPHARLIRICRKLTASPAEANPRDTSHSAG